MLEKFRDQLPPEIFTEPAYMPPVSSAERNNDRAVDPPRLGAARRGGLDGRRRRHPAQRRGRDADRSSSSTTTRRSSACINPFVRTCARSASTRATAHGRRAQMQERQKNFDYDIIPGRLVMSLTPVDRAAHDLRHRRRRRPGTLQPVGRRRPGGRRADREDHRRRDPRGAGRRVRALDRVLRQKQIWVPNWNKGSYLGRLLGRVRPARRAAALFAAATAYWWFDQAKYDALKAQGALR